MKRVLTFLKSPTPIWFVIGLALLSLTYQVGKMNGVQYATEYIEAHR